MFKNILLLIIRMRIAYKMINNNTKRE